MAQWTISADVARSGQVLLPWVEFSLLAADPGDPTLTYRWSDVPLALRDGLVPGQVLEWTRIVRALADDYGQFENQQFGWTLADVDRDLLDLLDDADYRFWPNRPCVVKLITQPALATGDTPMVLARGVVRDVRFAEQRKLVFTAEDVLSTEFSVTYLDEQLPRRRISLTQFGDCPDGSIDTDGSQEPSIVGLPEPIIYGTVTDADLAAEARKGPCPGLPVGTETISLQSWTRVLLAAHACKSVDALYLGGAVVDSGRYGVDVLCPGQTGWPFADAYRDIGGRRYTLVYLIGPAASGVLDGSAPLTADIQGIEDVGDGTGDLIENIYEQYQHWLTNWAFGDYQTGAWLAAPTYADGSDLLASADFVLAVANRGTYDGAGILGANGDLRTKRAWIGAWNASADARSGWDRLGRYTVTCGEEQAVTATFTDDADILAGTFKIDPRTDDLRNVLPYTFRRDWAHNAWTGNRRVRSQDSIDAYRMTRTDQERNLWFVRSGTIADDIAHHFLHRKMHPPRRIEYQTGLHGLLADLGRTIGLRHADGTPEMVAGTATAMVERLEVDQTACVVRMTGWDYGTLVPFPPDVVFEDVSAGPVSSYSYGQGSGVGSGSSGGTGGGTTTVVLSGDIAPIYLGGSREFGRAMAEATGWVDAPGYVDQFFDSAKVPGTAKARWHQRTDDAGQSVAVRIVAVDASGVPQFTAAESAPSTNTDWGHGESGHYQDLPFTPYSGVWPYRLQIKAGATGAGSVWVAGANVVLVP